MANTINNQERYEGKVQPQYFVGRIKTLFKGKEVILNLALFDHTQVVSNESLFNPGVARFPLPTNYTPELSPTPSAQPQTTTAQVSEAVSLAVEPPSPTSVEQNSDLSVERALAEVYGIHAGRNN